MTLKAITALLMLAGLVGCGGNSSTSTSTSDTSPLSPEISSFTASATTITEGGSVTLVAVFSNGSGSIDNGVGAVNSGASTTVSPTATTTFILTVTNSAGVTVTSSVNITVEAAPTISLTIVSPTNNQLVGTEVLIEATIQSELDISAVTAGVEGRLIALSFSSDAICWTGRRSCSPGFSGQLSLGGLTPGFYVLTVAAEDLDGSTVSEQRSILLDNKPVLTITEPLQFSVARPSLPLDVSCTDDVSDCEINVVVQDTQLTSAVNVLSETLDLSAYDGQKITLSIQGKDSSNQLSSESRTVYIESSTSLTSVKNFSGRIIDFDGQFALILDSGDNGDRLTILDITSDISTDVEVPLALSVSPTRSFLTPTGAIYTAQAVGGNVLTARIYDWNNSLLQDLGRPNSSASLTVAGDYAIWSVGSNLWRRQFSTEVNTQLSISAGDWKNSIGSNGVVAYWSHPNYAIERYDAGVYTTLASDIAYWNTYVVTDGIRFVYRKHDPCCSNQQYAITYHDGTNETVLTNFRDSEPSPGTDYRIINGWVAFTELGGLGQTHVWTNDPIGTPLQRTFFGFNSYIDGLSTDGEVMLINSGRRYLSDTTDQLTSVSSSLGRSTKINGVWYITIGRS